MTPELKHLIAPMFESMLCRRRVGERRSISFGFGAKIFHGKSHLADPYYGEWELGTYNASWRIVSKDRIILGSNDLNELMDEWNLVLRNLPIDRIEALHQVSKFDVRVCFSKSLHIDFISASSEDDEIFHIFTPDNMCLTYGPLNGWEIGEARGPWRPRELASQEEQ